MFHMLQIAATLLLLTATSALQFPEKHFGCPFGKNVCIYPIDLAALQCETLFDFQVELHVRENVTVMSNYRDELYISLTLPNGSVFTPEQLFGKNPVPRKWKIKAFEDSADETPDGYDSYALNYRNVIIPKSAGKGSFKVKVVARGVATEVTYDLRVPSKRRARNVILIIGDGMALPFLAAARLVSRGMVHGKYKDFLYMDKMDHFALQNPSGVDSIITDSANSATSMNTGQKSSVNALGVYADSGDENFAHPKQETFAEHIKRKFGMSVGVVTTAEVQDATPAAVWAHTRRRSEKAAITSQAINGCKDCVTIVKPDVLMGGGGKYFLPNGSVDGSNMYKNYSNAGYTVTHTRAQMKAAADNPKTQKLLTITHNENMEVWLDRNVYKENMRDGGKSPLGDGVAPTDQPNLDEMVEAALKILSKNKNGFYLMVEAASVDKAAHILDIPRSLSDVIEMDNTVGKTLRWAKENGDETLVIATADHGHGFDVFGTVDTKIWDKAAAATEEKPVLDSDNYCGPVVDNNGKVFQSTKETKTTNMTIRELNRARRKAVGTYEAAGYPDYIDSDGDHFPDTWDVRTTLAAGMNNFPDHTEDFRVSKKPRIPALPIADKTYLNNPADDPNGLFMSGNIEPSGSTGVHTFQDIGVFASGPGSERLKGVIDNTEIFHIMAAALGFGTNGEIDHGQYESGPVVKCINKDGNCHCAELSGSYKCSCKQEGPVVYVKYSDRMCKVSGNGAVEPV